MIYKTHFSAGGQYSSPACDLLELSVDTSFLVDSIATTTIDDYAVDPNEITL